MRKLSVQRMDLRAIGGLPYLNIHYLPRIDN